jgi:Trypsin-like peptidase domain
VRAKALAIVETKPAGAWLADNSRKNREAIICRKHAEALHTRMAPMIAHPSLQSLLIRMDFGATNLSSGTGFVCNSSRGRSLLMTNWHNVSGRNPTTGKPLSPTAGIPDRMRILHNRASPQHGRLEWIEKIEPLYNSDGSPRWIGHPTLGDNADFVALPLTDTIDVSLWPYDLLGGPSIAMSPAETISVVGFPFGLQAGGSLAIWATGFVASEPDVDFDGLPKFLIDCRTRPGQSGSAVILHRTGAVTAENGGIVNYGRPVTKFKGMYSSRINAESDIGVVWKASAIAELVNSI